MNLQIRIAVEGVASHKWIPALRKELALNPAGSSITLADSTTTTGGLATLDPVVLAAIVGATAQVLAALITAIAKVRKKRRSPSDAKLPVVIVLEGSRSSCPLYISLPVGAVPVDVELALAKIGTLRQVRVPARQE